MTQPTLKDFTTPEVKAAVDAYLLAVVYAETMREKVNAVYHDILTEYPVYNDRRAPSDRSCSDGAQILDPDQLYMSSDDDLVKKIYAEGNKRLRAAGIKPDSMSDDHCPALVAHHLQIQAENALIEVSGKAVGVTLEKLSLLEHRRKWIELVVGLVTSLPSFKNPLNS
jgi:hypothetical protein